MRKDEEHADPADNDQCREAITGFRDEIAQSVQLFVQRCFDTVVNLGGFEYLAAFRVIAHCENPADAVSLHDLGSAHDVVGRECCLGIKLGGIGGFGTNRFAGER